MTKDSSTDLVMIVIDPGSNNSRILCPEVFARAWIGLPGVTVVQDDPVTGLVIELSPEAHITLDLH